MSQQEIKKHDNILVIFLIIGFSFLLIHCIYFNYISFYQLFGKTVIHDTILKIYLKKNVFLGNPWVSKLLCLFFTLVAHFQFNPDMKKKYSSKKVVSYLTLGIIFYFMSIFIIGWSFIFYSILSILGFIAFIFFADEFKKYIYDIRTEDKFNEEEESFKQTDYLIENEYSVNIPYEYYFEKKWNKGYINFVNIFRGVLLGGTPGSGKSFAFIEQFLWQLIKKSFTLVLYDYKFPQLTKKAYHLAHIYMQGYKDKYGKYPKFYVVNFNDPRYSHRINPLAPRYIKTIDDASNASKIIFYNTMPDAKEKGGDFFSLSAGAYLSVLIYFLSFYQKGKYSTLPHVIALMSKPPNEIIPLLNNFQELVPLLSAFGIALSSQAYEQLAGQVASAQVPISRIASKELFWTLSGDDVQLEVNDIENPCLLCIGNYEPRRHAYAPAIGLLFTTIFSKINIEGQAPCHVSLDEFPTAYMEGIDNLIATGRQNLISVLLGIQDVAQLIDNYTEKISNKLKNLCGNLIVGQVSFETAKLFEDLFGQGIQIRKTTNISTDGNISYSYGEQLGSLFPQAKIAQLSQGDFGGRVADSYEQKIPIKIFKGSIKPDTSMIQKRELEIIYDFGDKSVDEVLNENFYKIFQDVDVILKELKESYPIPS